MNRRHFLRTCAGATALLAMRRRADAAYRSANLPLWKTSFRGAGPNGIPVAAPDAFAAPVTGVTHYTIDIRQFQDQICPTGYGAGPTTLWGYHPAYPLGGGTQAQRHLGGILVAQRGVPIQITFRNNLPPAHILPVDTALMGAELAHNRVSTIFTEGMFPGSATVDRMAGGRPTAVTEPAF